MTKVLKNGLTSYLALLLRPQWLIHICKETFKRIGNDTPPSQHTHNRSCRTEPCQAENGYQQQDGAQMGHKRVGRIRQGKEFEK